MVPPSKIGPQQPRRNLGAAPSGRMWGEVDSPKPPEHLERVEPFIPNFIPPGAPISGRMWSLGENGAASSEQDDSWVGCAKATHAFDKEMVGSLRGDMDTLLVFASLFSAVVTAFVIESYPGLSGTSSADSSAALIQLLLLREPERIATIATTSSSATSTSSIWINGLWFSSLVLSLNTVLGAVLVKQWLGEYELVTCSTTMASPREQVALRQLTFDSFGRWKVATIAEYLPVQLICALFLFFAGLVCLVWTLNAVVALVTSVLVGISTLFFLSTILLPSFFDLCALYSPQSWLCFYISRRIRRIFDRAATSAVYSFTDTWMDVCLNVLSRPSESKAYEIRGLFWVQTALGSWEPSLSAVLYRCAATLPAIDAARVIHRFWKRSTLACDSPTASNRFLHVGKLWTAIGSDTYWRLYEHLLDSIRSNNGHPNQDDSIIVFCSLHLILCHQGSVNGSRPEVQLLLAGLSHLAKISFQDGISVPHDTELAVASVLSYIAAQEDLYLPYMDEEALSCLDSFMAECSRHGLHPTFPTLSSICFQWQWNAAHYRRSTGGSLMELLSAMQLALQSQRYPEGVTVAISQWVFSGFERLDFDSWDTGTLDALRELVLSFRKLYDGGLALPAAVVERIDVLIVRICSPEVVCETLSTAIYSGVKEPFSKTNMSWWADRLDHDRHQVLRRFCNQFPPLKPPPTSTPSQIAHLRIICEAAPIWLWRSDAVDEMIASLSIVLAFCRLDVPDLVGWFPGMTSPDVFLAKVSEQLVWCIMKPNYQIEESKLLVSVMQCAIGKRPADVSDDPTLFIALTSGSLDLAFLCAPFPTAELVTEFGNLLETVAAFVRLCTFSGAAKEHVALVNLWQGKLTKLMRLQTSPLQKFLGKMETLMDELSAYAGASAPNHSQAAWQPDPTWDMADHSRGNLPVVIEEG